MANSWGHPCLKDAQNKNKLNDVLIYFSCGGGLLNARLIFYNQFKFNQSILLYFI
jgi:hypothetical protein